jgi:hypothetical protein
MSMEHLVEWELAVESEVLEENLTLYPQIPHELTWDRTQTTAVGKRWLTVWDMARPYDATNGDSNL